MFSIRTSTPKRLVFLNNSVTVTTKKPLCTTIMICETFVKLQNVLVLEMLNKYKPVTGHDDNTKVTKL